MSSGQADGTAAGMERKMADSENKETQHKRRRRGSRHRRRGPAAENQTAPRPQGGEKRGAPGERPRGGQRGDASRQPGAPAREREQGRDQGREREKQKPPEEKKPAAEKKKRFTGSSPLDPVYAPMSRRRRKSDDLEGTPLKSGTIISEDLFPSRGDPDDSADAE